MNIDNWPSVSYIISTLNCVHFVKRCISSIQEQDYPGKTEIIAADGLSTDGTQELLKQLGVRIVYEKEPKPEGVGSGKWVGYREAKHEVVIYIDVDNKLVQKDWTRKMIMPLMQDPTISFSICRMAVVPGDIALNRYLSRIGTDPFAAYKSIDAQLGFRNLKLEDKGEFYTYTLTAQRFFITGGYYFTAYKKTIDSVGGYTQDTDVVYKLVLAGKGTLAIPKSATIHHLINDSYRDFLRKRYKSAKRYFAIGKKQRKFHWIPRTRSSQMVLVLRILANLLLIPSGIKGMWLAVRDSDYSWLLHPVLLWLTTATYVYAFLNR